MQLEDFALERYLAQWEFTARYLLCSSDKDYTTICNSAPSEILALIALRARERVLARSHAILRPNLERLDRFFADWAGIFEWVRPRGGSIGFPRLVAGVEIDQVAADLVEQEGSSSCRGASSATTATTSGSGSGAETLPRRWGGSSALHSG